MRIPAREIQSAVRISIPRGDFFVTISPVRNAIPRENSLVRNSIPFEKFNFFVRMSFLSWLENVRKHPDRQIDVKAQVLV